MHSKWMSFVQSLDFLVVVEIFLKCNFKLAMAMSLNALKKLTKEELSNMVIDYQNKFDNMLLNINAELTSLRDRFTKLELQLLVTRRVNNNLVKQNRIQLILKTWNNTFWKIFVTTAMTEILQIK